ncbi:MAG: hypothetical protein OXD54_17535 [Candidatus Poribacteria bacterium]|nr:hypothetical protein [Candidatus Poribacteria bacterium]
MFKYKNSMLVFTILIFLIVAYNAQAQEQETQHEEYSESALRRFEIVTLSSLPFTAVHSYLGVRGVRMIQTNKIAPELSPQNYRVMGICAVSFSLFIGIWDWFHTRDVDRSAPSVPGRKPQSPPEEEVPTDGFFARVNSYGPYENRYAVSTYIGQPFQYVANTQLNMWQIHQSESLVIPLFLLRF